MKSTVERVKSCCGSTAAPTMADIKSLKYLQYEKGDDLYTKFVKGYFFPFLLRFHRSGILLWFVIFVISIVFGPRFLSLTKSDLTIPPGTPTATAVKAFIKSYPNLSTWPPSFIVLTADSGSIVGPPSRAVDLELNAFSLDNSAVVAGKTGYYDYVNTDFSFLIPKSLSADNRTMVLTVNYVADTDINKITDTVTKLLKFAADQSYPGIHVGCTGLQALFNELATGSAIAFETIDAVVLPIAICILGYNLRSYRHMLVAIANLGCTLLLALAILVPIAETVTINPFAPSILLTLGIAVCFDYSLFLLSRFREEIIVFGKTKEEAVYSCLLAAGHVIILSGTTLFVTFVLLIAFPQNFLQSVGYGCATIIFTAVLANMTVGPCLLLTFDGLTKFEMCPNFRAWCQCCCRKKTDLSKGSSDGNMTTVGVDSKMMIGSSDSRDTKMMIGSSDSRDSKMMMCSSDSRDTNTVTGSNDCHSNDSCTFTCNTADNAAPTKSTGSEKVLTPGSEKSVGCSSEKSKGTKEKSKAAKAPRQFWFHIAYFVTKRSYLTLLVAAAITIPFSIQFANLKASSDNNLVFLRGSSSLKFLHILSAAFSIGAIDPYQVMISAGTPGAVDTAAYYASERHLIQTLLDDEGSYVNKKSFTALSYFNGLPVEHSTSRSYLNSSSTAYYTKDAIKYRTLVSSLRNADRSASLILMETIVDPDAEIIVPFVLQTRKILTAQSNTPYTPGLDLTMYLLGGYCSTYDIQVILFALYPIMIASTIAVVLLLIGVNFASIGLPLRLALTIAISLSWTYGITAIVYQPGPGQDAFAKLNPVLLTSSGVYYLIPIMSFSVLVGLAMDYDIFLMCRVVEFRQLGWSNRAAVCLAVEKTGNVITAAGLIMSISFAGLLIPATTVLNQFGFVLFIGVAIDTFIVRTLLVPAAVTAFTLSGCGIRVTDKGLEFGDGKPAYNQEDGLDLQPYENQEPDDHEEKSVWRMKDVDANWWPTMMPRVLLSPIGEDEALWAGYNCPASYLDDMKALLDVDKATEPKPIVDVTDA